MGLGRLFTGSKPVEVDEQPYIDSVTTTLWGLTPTERKAFCNGFGSELRGLRIFTYAIPEYYRITFTSPADWHDIAYNMGGREWHRDVADNYFLKLMIETAVSLPLAQVPEALMWCMAAWKAVVYGGRFSFEYRAQPLTFAEMKREAKELMR